MSRYSQFISAAAAFAILTAPLSGAGSYQRTEHAYTVPAVTLTDRAGRPVRLDALLNEPRPVALQFIFTTCSTICPIMSATFGAAQSKLGDSVRLISISIDPENDTPAQLARYAAQFHAGPQWVFLTGSGRDIDSVRQAFSADEGGKMGHRPLTFLRGAPGARWTRLDGLTSAAELADECHRLTAGARIYREGVLPSGKPLQAIVQGDVAIEGRQWRCETCHRRSGFGSTEGGTLVPPIAAEALFRPGALSPIDLADMLFEDAPPLRLRTRTRSPRVRPAYTANTLAAAVCDGIDSAGHPLDPAMPRYRLDDVDLESLTGYLSSLGAAPAPGVDQTTIRFAAVFTEGIDRESLLPTMRAWFDRKNREADYQIQRRGRTAWQMEQMYRDARHWALDVWELTGAPERWGEQLEAHYLRQPVFAIVGGMAAGPWQPIAQFCDRFEMPCLFPETALPAGDGGYTVYFSRGITGEAAALAVHLRDRPVVQLYRDTAEGRAAAETFRIASPASTTLRLPAGAPAEFWQALLRDRRPENLVIWGDDSDLRHLDCGAAPVHVYLSATMVSRPEDLSCEAVSLTFPFALPGSEPKESNRARAWQLARGVRPGNDRMQRNAWYALTLLDYSISHLNGRFSREYLLETIEREAERSPNPGVFPQLSLGPGQRFASKGAYILQVGQFKSTSDWIVP